MVLSDGAVADPRVHESCADACRKLSKTNRVCRVLKGAVLTMTFLSLLSRFHVVASSPALRKKKESRLPLVADDVVSATTLERRSFTPNMRHCWSVFFFFFFVPRFISVTVLRVIASTARLPVAFSADKMR